jgi:hypothetical protein
MKKKNNLKQTEKKSYQQIYQDGLMEICMGILLVIMAGAVLRPIFSSLVIFVIIFIPIFLKRFRLHYTYPRVGFAKLNNPEDYRLMVIISVGSLLTIVIILLLRNQITNFYAWLAWIPFFIASLICGLLIGYALKSGAKRYYIYAILSLLSGLVSSIISVLSSDVTFWETAFVYNFFSFGVIILIHGIILFRLFLKKNPIDHELTEETEE